MSAVTDEDRGTANRLEGAPRLPPGTPVLQITPELQRRLQETYERETAEAAAKAPPPGKETGWVPVWRSRQISKELPIYERVLEWEQVEVARLPARKPSPPPRPAPRPQKPPAPPAAAANRPVISAEDRKVADPGTGARNVPQPPPSVLAHVPERRLPSVSVMYQDFYKLNQYEFLQKYPHVSNVDYDKLGRQILYDQALTRALTRRPATPADKLPVQTVGPRRPSLGPSAEMRMWDLAATSPIAGMLITGFDLLLRKLLGIDYDPEVVGVIAATGALGAELAGSFAKGAATRGAGQSSSPEEEIRPEPGMGRVSRRTSAREALRSRGIDVDDPYTTKKLTEFYERTRDPETMMWRMRADMGELRELVRWSGKPGVKKVRFLDPQGEKTPDIEVEFVDGRQTYVEVKTLTEAPVWAKRRHDPLKLKNRRRPLGTSWPFIKSIEDKIRHGQLSPLRPGVLVFRAPFETVTRVSLEGWREVFREIRDNGEFPEYLTIEVIGGGSSSYLVFEPTSNWEGKFVEPNESGVLPVTK